MGHFWNGYQWCENPPEYPQRGHEIAVIEKMPLETPRVIEFDVIDVAEPMTEDQYFEYAKTLKVGK